MSNAEVKKYTRIVAALEEWEVLKGMPTYEEAVAQLADYLSVSYPAPFFSCKAGNLGIQALNYAVLTQDEMDECKKHLKNLKIGGKKIKFSTNLYANVNYYGKEREALILPKLILWELVGVTILDAEDICAELSEKLGVALAVVSN